MTVVISGDVTPTEICDLLKQHFSGRNILIDFDGSGSYGDNEINSSDLIVSSSSSHESCKREVRELKETTACALDTVQRFQKQHQVLYDKYVLLRQLYDDQKISLLNTLWIHCGAHHPHVRDIPVVEDMLKFNESEDRIGNIQVGETLGQVFVCVDTSM